MAKLTANLVLARARSSDLESVKKLNCWGSDITDVSIFRKMPNIEVISLSVNKINTLEDFSHCKNLTELYVRKNNVQNLSDIHFLKKLPKLRVLWLADNPCATRDKYRMTVLKLLPNLQKLDNVPVQPEEINQAIEEGEDLPLPDEKTKSSTDDKNAEAVSPTSSSPERDGQGGGDTAVKLTLTETNKIREELGLKPLPAEKLSPAKTIRHHGSKNRNANILTAVLSLVKELDHSSLEVVINECRNRLDTF